MKERETKIDCKYYDNTSDKRADHFNVAILKSIVIMFSSVQWRKNQLCLIFKIDGLMADLDYYITVDVSQIICNAVAFANLNINNI